MSKVSVILTSFNHGKYLRESIDSVLNQTFTDFDLFIWDDGSSDDSVNIIESYKDSRIKFFKNKIPVRVPFIVNKIVAEHSDSEYIAVHHSDDIWDDNKLLRQIDFASANPEFGAVFTKAVLIGENSLFLPGNDYTTSNFFDHENRDRRAWLRYFFYKQNALCHPSVMYRRKCFEKNGGYRLGFGQMTDFDMWVRICMNSEIYIIPEKLVKLRIRDNAANMSSDRPDTRIRCNTELYRVIGNYLNIDSCEELKIIFPEAGKFMGKGRSLLSYVFARICLEPQSHLIAKTLGIFTLFDILQNKAEAEKLYVLHGFDYRDFIPFTGILDLFRLEEVMELHKNISEYKSQIQMLESTVAQKNGVVIEQKNEKEQFLNQMNKLHKHCSDLERELNIIKNEKEQFLNQMNELQKHCSDLERELNIIKNSKLWKFSGFLRRK